MRRAVGALVAAAVLAWSATATAAEVVVVKAIGVPEVPVGTILDLSQSVDLPAGASLTLLDSAGRKTQVDGPHSGPLGGASADESRGAGADHGHRRLGLGVRINVVKSLARLFKETVADTSSVGAFRGIGTTTPMPDPWLVDVSRQGDHCVTKGRMATLWHPRTGDGDTLSIQHVESRAMTHVDWPAGLDRIDWPQDLPIIDGGAYMTRLGRAQTAKTLAIHVVPDSLPTRAHQVAWMADRGCDLQAMLLVVSADVDALADRPSRPFK